MVNERRRIEERAKKKEQEIQDLEEQIRDARTYLQALQDVLKMLPRDADQSAAAVLRPGSTISRVREEIIRKGHPMHVTELLEALGRTPTKENRASLSSPLAAYVRKGEIFSRPAPNTFGLIELGHNNSPDATDEAGDEPPPDFGRDPRVDDDEIPL